MKFTMIGPDEAVVALARRVHSQLTRWLELARRPSNYQPIFARSERHSRRSAHRFAEQLAGRPLSAKRARQVMRKVMKARGTPRAPQAEKPPLPPVPTPPTRFRQDWV